jgi:hypothetical protein
MMKTIGLLAILPLLSYGFFIPFSVIGLNENKENTNIALHEVKNVELYNSEKNTTIYAPLKICPFIDYVDKELCNDNTSIVNENRKEIVYYLGGFKYDLKPKDLCPLLQLVDKTFCNSTHSLSKTEMSMGDKSNVEKADIDPKDLCPLLQLVQTKLCS